MQGERKSERWLREEKRASNDQHLELSKKIESALKSAKNILRNDAFSVPGKNR